MMGTRYGEMAKLHHEQHVVQPKDSQHHIRKLWPLAQLTLSVMHIMQNICGAHWTEPQDYVQRMHVWACAGIDSPYFFMLDCTVLATPPPCYTASSSFAFSSFALLRRQLIWRST